MESDAGRAKPKRAIDRELFCAAKRSCAQRARENALIHTPPAVCVAVSPCAHEQNGPRGYRSRSFESFQKALEAGDPKAKNMPVFFAKEKLARGEIKLQDIPYMQRGGSWDNSDVKGARKNKWTTADATYDKVRPRPSFVFFVFSLFPVCSERRQGAAHTIARAALDLPLPFPHDEK